MKRSILFIVIGLLFQSISAYSATNEWRLLLFSENRYAYTNNWYFPYELKDKVPTWNPESGHLPLQVEDAVGIARKWIRVHEGSTNAPLESVSICPVRPNMPELKHIFYYKMYFQLGLDINHEYCVVLMNGQILTPEVDYNHTR